MTRLIALTAALWASQAVGQSNCGPYDHVARGLSVGYHEAPIGNGLNDATRVFELWVSEAGTWTIVMIKANGQACIMASGESWAAIEPKLGIPG